MIFVFNPTVYGIPPVGAVLNPSDCVITEKLGGAYELSLTHPYDDIAVWRNITEGSVIQAPVPATPKPMLTGADAAGALQMYTLTRPVRGWVHENGASRAAVTFATGATVVGQQKSGEKPFVPTAAEGSVSTERNAESWYVLWEPVQGITVYSFWDGAFTHVRQLRSDEDALSVYGETAKRVTPYQYFRVYRVSRDFDGVTAYARHIFYDAGCDSLLNGKITAQYGEAALQKIMVNDSGFDGWTQMPTGMAGVFDAHARIGSRASADYTGKNRVDAMLAPGGFCETWRAEILRDNYSLYAVPRVGGKRSVTIREGETLEGLRVDVDVSEVTGAVYALGKYVSGSTARRGAVSERTGEYGFPIKTKTITVPGAVGGGDVTNTNVNEMLTAAAQAELATGIDLPLVEVDMRFYEYADTQEYAELGRANRLYLGDSARLLAPSLGVDLQVRVTEYSYDALRGRYNSLHMSTVNPLKAIWSVAGRAAASAVVSARGGSVLGEQYEEYTSAEIQAVIGDTGGDDA